MPLLGSLRSVLVGASLGALAGALAAWLAPAPPVMAVAAAIVGGALSGLLERGYRLPLRRLARRLEERSNGGEAAPSRGGTDEPAAAAIERAFARLERRLEWAEDELGTVGSILDALSDGVLVVDRSGRVELCNPAFGALVAARDPRPGQTAEELSRLPALAAFLDRLPDLPGIGVERIESAAGRTLELRGRRLAGERRVVVARDLTEQVRLDRTRRDLVANVSHELRTPLTAIRGYAENLRDGALAEPATAERFLDRILAQSGRLEALLEDLLALSRLEGERLVDLEPGIDLAALTERALETVHGLAAERRVELRFERAPVPAIAGHEDSLERLLLNLLENAIKYNRPGGDVTVRLSLHDGELLLAVADHGIGVPESDLERIFERFYRVDTGRSRGEGGTGLGLAIVKHAAQLHGGRVEVASELGRGSVFRVFLPPGG